MRSYYVPSRKLNQARKSHAFNNSAFGRGSKLFANMTFGTAFDNTAQVEGQLQDCEEQYQCELGEYMAQIAPMFQGLSDNEIDQKLFAMHDEKYAQAKPISRKYSSRAFAIVAIVFLVLNVLGGVMALTSDNSGSPNGLSMFIAVIAICILITSIIVVVRLVNKSNNAYNEADYLRGIIEQRKAAAQEAIEAVHEQKVVSATNLFMGNKR